uniref:Endo/exonuclease/phosphatase domain-containing protein n=1 Tax=Pristionchus pacificus TaxID=54126 RepID=A0A8R1USY3_PRIPA
MISRRHLLASFRLGRVWMRPSLTKEERVCSVDRPFTYDSPGMSFLPVGVLWSASLIRAKLSFLNTRGVSKCAEPPKLTVIYANIRSILNEVNHSCLKSQLEANEYFVYCFTESWLRKTDPDGASIGSFSSNYCVIRCDRDKKRGGESKLDSHEILVVDLRVGTESARIILLYRVPALSQACSEHIWEKLDDYTKCAHPTVIVGDFNLPEIKWPKTTQHYSGASADFIKCCDEIGLVQLILRQTRKDAFLDLLLSNSNSVVQNVEQLPNYGNLDHSAFSFQLLLAPEEQRAKYVKNFQKADYGKINTLLANIDWNAFFEIKMTVNEMYERFITLLDEIIEKYIPLMRIDSTGKPMPDHIHRLSKRRHLAWSQFLMDDKKSSKLKFEKLHAEYNREVTKFQQNLERKIIEANDRKKFYGYLKSKLSNARSSAVLMICNIKWKKGKAELLAETFSKVFTKDNGETPHFSHARENVSNEYKDMFSCFEICELIEKWKSSSCRTPDNISLIFIKETAVPLSAALEIIFRKSYELSEVPDRWRYSTITPLKKKAPYSNPLNYRPVSITSFFCRVFEKCIAKQMISDCENYVTQKAATRANIIFRGLTTNNAKVMVNAYTTYVRPMVEFRPSVAFPVHEKEAGKLEKLQNKVTRLISYKCFGYNFENRPRPEERNEMLNLKSLTYRRKINDFKHAYELFKSNLRGAGYKVCKEPFKTKVREKSFANRISNVLYDVLRKGKIPTKYSEFMSVMSKESILTSSPKIPIRNESMKMECKRCEDYDNEHLAEAKDTVVHSVLDPLRTESPAATALLLIVSAVVHICSCTRSAISVSLRHYATLHLVFAREKRNRARRTRLLYVPPLKINHDKTGINCNRRRQHRSAASLSWRGGGGDATERCGRLKIET